MNNTPLPLEQLRLRNTVSLTPKGTQRPPRHAAGEHFLKGPIPLGWVQTAACLPGKALHVGMVLWFRAGLTSSRSVRLGRRILERFGVKRHAAARAIRALESANLISVVRARCRSPEITLLKDREGDAQ